MLNVLLMNAPNETGDLLDKYSASLMLLVMTVMGLLTLLLLVPRLLKARHERLEMLHAERMKSLEMGQVPPHQDERSIAAGRTASLVPIFVMTAAAAVTCFMAAYQKDSLFSIALAVWTVSGAVSLAAITGGIALLGRLANLPEEPEEENHASNESNE